MSTEQERNDAFEELVGGTARADRLQQLWRTYGTVARGDLRRFREEAEREGFTRRQVEAFVQL